MIYDNPLPPEDYYSAVTGEAEPIKWGSEFLLPNSGFTWSHAHADTNKLKQLMNGMGLRLNVDYKITVDMFTTGRRIKISLKPGLESIESAIMLQWPHHGKNK